jgi:hypothetical protein
MVVASFYVGPQAKLICLSIGTHTIHMSGEIFTHVDRHVK